MRPGRSRTIGAVAGWLVLAAAMAGAQGVSLNRGGSGARAAGMGDAFVAVSDDGTAASWNPAGLAQLRQPELSLVYVVSNNGMRFSGLRSPDQRLAYSTQRFAFTSTSLEFASAAVPFSIARKPVTLQLGWHRLYRLDAQLTGDVVRVPIDPPGPAQSVSRDDVVDGRIDLFSLAGAVKLTSHLAVGGSLDLWRGHWTERITLMEDAGGQGSPDFFASHHDTRIRGHNFTAGLLLIHPRWNAGLVYHAPFWASYVASLEGRSTIGPPQSLDLHTTRVRLPRSVAAGIACRLGPRWTAAASLTQDQWSAMVIDRVPGYAGRLNFFDGQPPELSATRDTVSLNLGLEHLFLREGSVVPLRLGLGFEPQGNMDPVARDPVSFVMVAAGAGYNTNRFKLDAAVQYRWADFGTSDTLTVERARNGGPRPDALGRADAHEWRVKVSVIYRIQDTETLGALIRKVF